MSIRAAGTGRYIRRTASLPVSTAVTICGFARMTKRASQYQYWGIENATTSSTAYLLIGYNNTGGFEISTSGVGGAGAFASAPADETPFFWALTCSGTGVGTLNGYWAYVTDSTFKTATARGASFTTALMSFGNDSFDEWCNAAFDMTWVYDKVLTQNELLAIMRGPQDRLLIRDKIHLWARFSSVGDIYDLSGNGRHVTLGGTNVTDVKVPIQYVRNLAWLNVPSSSVNLSGVGGIASAEVFGTPVISLVVAPTAIAGGEAFGAQSVQANLTGINGIASAEAVGAPVLSANIAPTGIASSETIGTPALSVNIAGVGNIASAETVGAPAISANVAPTGVASAEAFGTPVISLGVALAAIASGEAFGTQSVKANLTGINGIASAEAVGTPVVSANVAPTGITSSEAIGTPALSVNIAGIGNIASGEAFGTASISTSSPVNLSGVGNIASDEAVGTPVVSANVAPTGITSSEAIGTPALSVNIAGIGNVASAETFGTAIVSTAAPVNISGVGNITSEEVFGSAVIGITITPAGIATDELFGSPTFVLNVVSVGTIVSDEAFGTMLIYSGSVPYGATLTGIHADPLIGSQTEQLVSVDADPIFGKHTEQLAGTKKRQIG